MNLSDIYSKDIKTLVSVRSQLDQEIYQCELNILRSKEAEPWLIEWLKNNLLSALLYIPNARINSKLGREANGEQEMNYNLDYINSIILNSEDFDSIMSKYDNLLVYEVCDITIEIVANYFINLTIAENVSEDYEYQINYEPEEKYIFIADILEHLLIENLDEILNYNINVL